MSASADSPREIRVRFVRAEACGDAGAPARAREVLGDDERRTLARLRPEGARRDFLATHALRRRMLADLAGTDPARLRFHAPPRGCPRVIAPPGARRLRCSIAHADGIGICAVAEGCDVGADVESLRNLGREPLEVAGIVCSREEEASLRALPEPARAGRLLHLWTRKEAAAKAMGLGFQASLPRIGPHDGLLWRFRSWRLTPHHVAAVAVLGAAPGERVVVRVEEESRPV